MARRRTRTSSRTAPPYGISPDRHPRLRWRSPPSRSAGCNRANWRWLTVAGALTYPFYLVHEHLGWVAIKVYHRDLGIPSYGTFLLTVATMLLLAWLLNRYVEERLAPKLRGALSKPRP